MTVRQQSRKLYQGHSNLLKNTERTCASASDTAQPIQSHHHFVEQIESVALKNLTHLDELKRKLIRNAKIDKIKDQHEILEKNVHLKKSLNWQKAQVRSQQQAINKSNLTIHKQRKYQSISKRGPSLLVIFVFVLIVLNSALWGFHYYQGNVEDQNTKLRLYMLEQENIIKNQVGYSANQN